MFFFLVFIQYNKIAFWSLAVKFSCNVSDLFFKGFEPVLFYIKVVFLYFELDFCFSQNISNFVLFVHLYCSYFIVLVLVYLVLVIFSTSA